MVEERPHQDEPATDLSQLPCRTLIERVPLLKQAQALLVRFA